MIKYKKTWQKVTHESAENGDVDSHGFVDIAGTEWTLDEVQRGEHGADEDLVFTCEDSCGIKNLYDILRYCEDSNNGWYTTADADIDMFTGDSTTYAYHPVDEDSSEFMQALFNIGN